MVPIWRQVGDEDITHSTGRAAPSRGGRRQFSRYTSSRAIAIFSQTTDNSSDTAALNQIPTEKSKKQKEKRSREPQKAFSDVV